MHRSIAAAVVSILILACAVFSQRAEVVIGLNEPFFDELRRRLRRCALAKAEHPQVLGLPFFCVDFPSSHVCLA